jgi:hypothetical protein
MMRWGYHSIFLPSQKKKIKHPKELQKIQTSYNLLSNIEQS